MAGNDQKVNAKKDAFHVQSVDRALLLIDTIYRDGNKGLTLLELSAMIGLPNSTVYRLLQNLLKWDYVSLDDKGRYTLGLIFLSLAHQVGEGLDLLKTAEPHLDALSEKSSETVYLTVFDEAQKNCVYIAKRSGNGNIRLVSNVGSRNGVYCSAAGKALLFSRPDEEIRQILADIQIVRKTKNTLTEVEDILREISESKAKGYSIDMEESENHVACIAAPVYGNDGGVVAAVSISGVVSSITPPQRFDVLRGMLLESADSISSKLGYRKP